MALELVLREETVLPSVIVSLLAGYVPAKSQVTVANGLRPNEVGFILPEEKLRFSKPLLMVHQIR
jgi:hypothetical protein